MHVLYVTGTVSGSDDRKAMAATAGTYVAVGQSISFCVSVGSKFYLHPEKGEHRV